jgi:hypothetical protein
VIAEHGRRRASAAAASGHHRSRRGVGEHGETRCAQALGRCEDAFPQLKLDRDRPEKGSRWRGGARFSPVVMAIDDPRVLVMEGGGGGAG